MNPDILLWIVGVGIVPLLVAAVYIVNGIRELLYMHRHPEKTGFGTEGMREVIEANTKAFKDLSNLVKWLTKEMGHSERPPSVGN